MKSKAALGNHPIHPLLVPIPIGAFFLVLWGDVAQLVSEDPFWYRFSAVALGVGITFALAAAAAGAVDYMSLRMPARAARFASWHALAAGCAVLLFGASTILRQSGAGFRTGRWWAAVGASTLGFLLIATAAWIGGKLAHEERIGVVERQEETAEPAPSQSRVPRAS
ncbi:MAG TPA: DUF2231 domain-containing protein [Thermoanaerobaculia bacterium]|jgi:uncharacterized membrane protein